MQILDKNYNVVFSPYIMEQIAWPFKERPRFGFRPMALEVFLCWKHWPKLFFSLKRR